MLSPADEQALTEDMAGFAHDPLGHVLYSYPWGVHGTSLADKTGPHPWQREMLDRIGQRLRAGVAVHFEDVIREAVASGHGIGKSALVAWLIRWALDTMADARCVVTANTDKQLTTKTWPELTKWHHMGMTKHWWVCTATALYSADADHEKTWRADAIPWSEHNTEAFAGLHNEGKRILVIFDEASKIADRVWEVAEGALTDTNTEILWCVFGNPTQASGRFRECFRKFKERWHTQSIDARTVAGTNRKQHEQWIADYGIDDDFVKIRVRGMFPNVSVKGLFSEADVDESFRRGVKPGQYDFAPVVLSCDPAWSGDNKLVIGMRQGLSYRVLREMPKNDNDGLVASLLAQFEDEHRADAVFIDLGYGTGIASFGRTWGRNWTLVGFGEGATDPSCVNRRAEMYRNARDWIKQGGSIYGCDQLREDLLAIEVKPRADGKLLLESKQEMLERDVMSPDHADAFVLTFAAPVLPKAHADHSRPSDFAKMDYKPHSRLARR